MPPPPQPAVMAGWKQAVAGAVVTSLILGAIAEAMAFLLYAAEDRNRPSVVGTARFGGFVFYAFHHVGLRFTRRSLGGVNGDVTVALALLTGTLIGILLLARSGRAVAHEAGGSTMARGVHGAKVAVPYAAIAFGLAFVVRVPEAATPASFPPAHPSYLGAALWPLGIAVVAGFMGGVRTGAPSGLMATSWGARFRAAARGGVWMLGLGLVLSFIGLVALAPTAPDATRAYFRPFDQSALRGIEVIAATLLVVPNMAAWVLFPAMGSCLEISGSIFGFGASGCFLSYSQFPTARAIVQGGATGFPSLPGPPPGYFLFLLAPLIAVLVGGAIAAQRSGAASKQEAGAVGALAGLAFALLALATAVLSTISAKATGLGQGLPAGSLHAHVGPALATSFLFSLLWGIVGGGAGGLWHARRLPLVPPVRLELPSWDQAWAAGPR